MRLKERPIAIVGAGIGGAAAALALAMRGARVEVFEQAREIEEVGAGLQIGPNGVKVLDRLGVRQQVLGQANRPEAVALRRFTSGQEVARVPFGAKAVDRWGAPMAQIHRADLLDVLARQAVDCGAEFVTDAQVTGVQRDGREAVLQGEETLGRFDLVIGADGLKSTIRSFVTGAHEPVFSGQVAWRALVALEVGDLDQSLTHVFLGSGLHVVVYPLKTRGVWNLVAVRQGRGAVAEDWRLRGDPVEYRDTFSMACPELLTLLEAADAPLSWGLYTHAPLESWVNGPVALLGDACHPMLPFLAQGATMALEDAYVLAALLDNGPQAEALAKYQARRLPRTARVQAASARNANIYHARWPVSAAIGLGMGAVARFSQGGLAGQFDWLYGADETLF